MLEQFWERGLDCDAECVGKDGYVRCAGLDGSLETPTQRCEPLEAEHTCATREGVRYLGKLILGAPEGSRLV